MRMKAFKIFLVIAFILSVTALALMPVMSVNAQVTKEAPTLDVVFNPSGTHYKDGILKIRLDFYPINGCKSYPYYLNWVVDTESPEYLAGYPGKVDKEGNPIDLVDYEKWLDGLPHVWQLNPCLSHFVKVPADIDKTELDVWVKETFHADVTATIDDCMTQVNSAHLISPYMKDKSTTFTSKAEEDSVKSINLTKDETQKTLDVESVNITLADYKIEADKGTIGTIEQVEPKSIDVGWGCEQDITWIHYPGYTLIDNNNPANADGSIDTVEIQSYSVGLSGTEVAIFYYVSSLHYSTRDSEYIGVVTEGTKRTFSGLDMDIETDDLIGITYTNGYLLKSDTGNAHFTASGDKIPSTNQAYTVSDTGGGIFLYGTGTESGGGGNIAKFMGITWADISKINGISVGSLAKILGVEK